MSAQGLGSRAVIGKFFNRLEQANHLVWSSRIAMRMDSDQASETYKWLGQVPALREWVGGRQAKGFTENGFTVINKTFEGTLKVLVDEIRRDKSGQVQIRIDELADRAAGHDGSLISALILNGHATVCYDGQYFFDTDHAEGSSGAQANDIAYDISDGGTGGTPTVPTARTMQAAIMAGIAKILGFVGDQGEPMNELATQFDVHAGPTLMPYVLAAIQNPVLDSGATNTLVNQSKFKIEPVINARLAGWTDKIAVFRTDAPTKPFIVQTEEGVTVAAIAEGSECEFKNNWHEYGVKKIGNAAYGMWQQACRVTLQA